MVVVVVSLGVVLDVHSVTDIEYRYVMWVYSTVQIKKTILIRFCEVTQTQDYLIITEILFVVCWLLNVPATCKCISGTDLLRQFYVLPH